MIDVHMIITGRENELWMKKALASLEKEPVNLFFVNGRDYGTHIGKSRIKGFSLGTSKFVTYVDPDDWVAPGIYQKLLNEWSDSLDAVYSRDVLTDVLGVPYATKTWEPGHAMLIKRENIREDLLEMSPYGGERWLKKMPKYRQLEVVGYYYRQDPNSIAKQTYTY